MKTHTTDNRTIFNKLKSFVEKNEDDLIVYADGGKLLTNFEVSDGSESWMVANGFLAWNSHDEKVRISMEQLANARIEGNKLYYINKGVEGFISFYLTQDANID